MVPYRDELEGQSVLRMWSNKTLFIYCWSGCRMVEPLWKSIWQFLIKLNIVLKNNPTIIILESYQIVMKTCPQKTVHRSVQKFYSYSLKLEANKMSLDKLKK